MGEQPGRCVYVQHSPRCGVLSSYPSSTLSSSRPVLSNVTKRGVCMKSTMFHFTASGALVRHERARNWVYVEKARANQRGSD